MFALISIVIVLAIIVILTIKHVNIGTTMFIGSISIFFLSSSNPSTFFISLRETFLSLGSWNIFLSMYFVMCLEHLLRTGGIVEGFLKWTRKKFKAERLILATMPAVLGLLPSLGGAIFSAPFVDSTGNRFQLSAERKTAINLWFRHVWEFTNPIIPAILLASVITNIPLGSLVSSQIWITVEAFILGYVFLLTGKAYRKTNTFTKLTSPDEGVDEINQELSIKYPLLALGPIIFIVLLVTIFNINIVLSLGIVVSLVVLFLRLDTQKIVLMLKQSLDLKLFWSLLSILFFEKMLVHSGIVNEIVATYQNANLSMPLMAGITAFTVGFLTGASQPIIALAFPIINALMPGNYALIAIGFVAGQAGQLLSPAHLCLIVTLEYFKADLFRTLLPILIIEIFMVASVYVVTALFY